MNLLNFVQIQSVVDVSKPAYGQLQKLKGKSLDEGEPTEKKYLEPKVNRLLLLELTDGVTNLQAMEYQPIKQLNAQQLLPGAKVMALYYYAILKAETLHLMTCTLP